MRVCRARGGVSETGIEKMADMEEVQRAIAEVSGQIAAVQNEKRDAAGRRVHVLAQLDDARTKIAGAPEDSQQERLLNDILEDLRAESAALLRKEEALLRKEETLLRKEELLFQERAALRGTVLQGSRRPHSDVVKREGEEEVSGEEEAKEIEVQSGGYSAATGASSERWRIT